MLSPVVIVVVVVVVSAGVVVNSVVVPPVVSAASDVNALSTVLMYDVIDSVLCAPATTLSFSGRHDTPAHRPAVPLHYRYEIDAQSLT